MYHSSVVVQQLRCSVKCAISEPRKTCVADALSLCGSWPSCTFSCEWHLVSQVQTVAKMFQNTQFYTKNQILFLRPLPISHRHRQVLNSSAATGCCRYWDDDNQFVVLADVWQPTALAIQLTVSLVRLPQSLAGWDTANWKKTHWRTNAATDDCRSVVHVV